MPSDADSARDALEEPWRRCLSLAWAASGAGAIPVGAALVDRSGSSCVGATAMATVGRIR